VPEHASSRRSLGINFAANAVLGLLGIASGALAAHLLHPSGRGQLAAIQVVALFLTVAGMVGMSDAIVFRLARTPKHGGKQLSTALGIGFVGSVVAALLAAPLLGVLMRSMSSATVTTTRWFLVSCPVLALILIWQGALRGCQRFASWNGIRIALALGWVLALVTSAVVERPTAAVVSAIYLGILVVVFLPTARLVARRGIEGPYGFDRRQMRPLLRFGLPAVGASLPQFLNLRLDQLMLTAFVHSSQLGLYAAAAGFSWIVNPILQAIATLSFPRIAATENADRRREQFLFTSRFSLVVSILVVLGLAAVTPVSFTLLNGSEFSPAVHLAVMLVFAGGILGYAYILEEGVRGLGKPSLALYAELSGLGVTVVALGVAVPIIHIEGAAVASILGYSTSLVVVAIGATRTLHATIAEMFILNRRDLAVLWQHLRPQAS
jgi:O-antigen/teichoic acid export membrane protein